MNVRFKLYRGQHFWSTADREIDGLRLGDYLATDGEVWFLWDEHRMRPVEIWLGGVRVLRPVLAL